MDNLKKLSTAILNHSDAKGRLERTYRKKKVNETLANTTAILRDAAGSGNVSQYYGGVLKCGNGELFCAGFVKTATLHREI